MNSPPTPHATEFSPRSSPARRVTVVRVSSVLIIVGGLSLLAMAANLRPSASGVGTHQQLGLPPCTSLVIFGVRCPACGMTTSWAHFTRGQWIASLTSNAGGFALAILTVVGLPVAARAACQNRWPSQTVQSRISWSVIAAAAITLVDWLWRLS